MITKIHYIISFLLLITSIGYGQNNYPEIIRANTTKTVIAGQTDLWIITSTQMDSVIATGMAAKKCDSLNFLFKSKIEKLKSKNIELQAINDTLKQGYSHYIKKWNDCDKKLEINETKLVRQKQIKFIFGGSGLIVGFVLALLIL